MMNRRQFLVTAATLGTAAAALPVARALMNTADVKGIATPNAKLTPPSSGSIRVAVVISQGVNVIDFSGPWGVFESVSLPNRRGHPFELFTVSDDTEIVHSGTGLQLKPNYSFANVPAPHVIVVPAQRGSDGMREWLRKANETADVTMSVCTGAFHLARVGLLDGKVATTHHDFFDRLEQQHPNVQVKRGVRFVEGEKISTAGGLTSGTDLALRVVERYFGREVAQRAADYMEYYGTGWIV